MKGVINKEEAFKVLKSSFAIAPTSAGYTLAYGVSPDGPFTNYTQAVPAGENLIVNGVVQYQWFKLVGNVDDNVEAIF